jgi:hypothetical protein
MHVYRHHRDLPQLGAVLADRAKVFTRGSDQRRRSGLARVRGKGLGGVIERIQPPATCSGRLGQRDQFRNSVRYAPI